MMMFLIGGVIVLWQPRLWLWVLSALLINHFTLAIAGLIPRSAILGPNITRLPEAAARRGDVAITIDDGPDPEVTPLVLDVLDRYHAKATFFCIAKRAAQYPDLCRDIIRRGHSIENHSFSHQWYFSLLGQRRILREIVEAQRVLSEVSGQPPAFFRPAAGLRNHGLEPMLIRTGLRLCSWSRRGFDTRVRDADKVLRNLTRDLQGGDILLLHDGNAARLPDGRPVILVVLPRLLTRIEQANLTAVTLCSAFL